MSTRKRVVKAAEIAGILGSSATVKPLRIVWIPQIPMPSFKVLVRTLREARLLLDALADYDLFQFKHRVKGDYSNAGGLQEFDRTDDTDGPDGSWVDWYDDEGRQVEELTETEIDEADRERLEPS